MENLHNIEQGTLLLLSQENNLDICVESFLIDRKAQNLSSGTLTFYRNKLRYFQDYCESQLIKQVIEISPYNIRAFLLMLEENNHNPGGIHACYRAIKTFLRWWDDEMELEGWKNPIRKVSPPKVPQIILNPVDNQDVSALLATCKHGTFTDARDKAILLCLLDSGVRAQELLSMDLQDCDLFSGQILIKQGKGRKSRYVFIGHKTRKSIRAYIKLRNDHERAIWVRDDCEGRLDYFGLRSMIVRRSHKTGLQKIPSLHSFRRQFALSCLKSGMNVYILQNLMGHSDLSVLQRYLKISNVETEESYKLNSPVDRWRL